MIRFFRDIKLRSFGSYLKYAIGEIILVVIGILIAVSINNWNEERKKENALNNILSIVAEDIKKDTTEAARILNLYKERENLYIKLMNNSFTKEELAECRSCPYLITSRRFIDIEKRGYNLLQNFQNISKTENDELIVSIIYFYSEMISITERIKYQIEQNVTDNLTYWRDNYNWFNDFIQKRITDDFINYIYQDPEYKNRVALYYAFVYENYIIVLESFLDNSKKILNELEQRIKKE